MSSHDQLRFSLSDSIKNMPVTPEHVSLALLGEFQEDVAEFLKGSTKEVDPAAVVVSLEAGSLVFVVSGLLAATALWSDISKLNTKTSLDTIDPKRANVVERWQAKAQKNPLRSYRIADETSNISVAVNAESKFIREGEIWAYAEKYLYGEVTSLGGKTNANVHLTLEDGETVIITSTHDFLKANEQNLLYRPVVVHVHTEENLHTGKLQNSQLISLELHEPHYDEAEFQAMVTRGTRAWADIGNASSWVEAIRSGKV
jgi:hypothetical protein